MLTEIQLCVLFSHAQGTPTPRVRSRPGSAHAQGPPTPRVRPHTAKDLLFPLQQDNSVSPMLSRTANEQCPVCVNSIGSEVSIEIWVVPVRSHVLQCPRPMTLCRLQIVTRPRAAIRSCATRRQQQLTFSVCGRWTVVGRGPVRTGSSLQQAAMKHGQIRCLICEVFLVCCRSTLYVCTSLGRKQPV